MKTILFKYHLIIAVLLSVNSSFGQETVFTFEEFLEIVKKHHPISYQAELKLKKGEAYKLKARGGFDPKLDASFNQKYFDGKNYYSHLNGGLKIPTWFGVTGYLGYENNEGVQLNPENYNPESGLVNGGLSITLGRGLFIDSRRAELKQAEFFLNSSVLEQRIILNDLTYKASQAYLEWQKYYNELDVYDNALKNAKATFLAVKQSFQLGDKPAIDTVEYKIVVQNRELKYEQAKLNFNNKTLMLQVYLWQDGYVPLEIDSTLVPGVIQNDLQVYFPELNLLDSVIENHPEVELYKNKIAVQRIDYRLNKENLKPVLDLKYNILNEPVNDNPITDLSVNNYKWGATLSYPIFTRKERANLKLADIKIKETTADVTIKKAELKYKINASVNSARTSLTQADISRVNVIDYNKLFNSEKVLFGIGESSIFMLNSREKSLIESKIKMIKAAIDQKKSLIKYNYLIFNP
jgi:outer membrane protein TolC